MRPAAQFRARRWRRVILKEGLPRGVLLNVNVPQPWNGDRALHAPIVENHAQLLQPGTDPRGRRYYWLHEQQFIEGIDPDTDHAAIRDGAISITPLVIDHTDAASLNHLSKWTKLLETASKE